MTDRVVVTSCPPAAAARSGLVTQHVFEDVLFVEEHLAHVQRYPKRGGHAGQSHLGEPVERPR